jgi:hypothetical protein
LIHLEPKSAFDEGRQAGHHTVSGPLAADIDVGVVSVPYEAMSALVELPIELIQHDVAQQRRQATPLRGALLGVDHHAVWEDHFRLQQSTNQPDQPAVGDPEFLQPRK